MFKQEMVTYFMSKGVLISPEFFETEPSSFNIPSFYLTLNKKVLSKPLVLNQDLFRLVHQGGVLDFNWVDFDCAKVLYEKTKSHHIYSQFIKDQKSSFNLSLSHPLLPLETASFIPLLKKDSKYQVSILSSYDSKAKKREVQDFVKYFKKRYDFLKNVLCSRQELQESLSIARLPRKKEGEVVTIIGLVLDKNITKNENIKITLEDTTGVFDVLISKNKTEVYQLARDLVFDEVIGITGVMGSNIIFCNSLYLPEIPVNHELKKAPDEAYVVFISDIHFGIKHFLAHDFMNFILWLRGEYGTEQQRDVSAKVGYLFITGDVVEGVGIYPGQEEDLEIKDVYKQYEEATRYLKMIPERIKIIICGGNHDALRMSEPQPIFDKDISKGFYEIPNLIMVSNPGFVNIHSSEGFPGFDVLMYHGFSFPYFADNVPSIRDKGGLARCDLIMKFLLQRRHLAPSHSSTLYVPDDERDPLVIEQVPDIFVSGHIHQITVGSYRNVSLINSSCWVVQSEDNAKRGIIPHPGKIPLLNLKTREIKIMNFLDDSVKVLYTERMGLK